MKNLFYLSIIILFLSACKNAEWEFPDSNTSTVYFSYQYPVRTITMGEDIFDTTLDNQRKFSIMATWGGGYTNKKDVTIGFEVDQSMVSNVNYKDGTQVRAMPTNYYKLASNKIVIPKGAVAGGVEVQLTDDFFADPLALKRNYVIPLIMRTVEGADVILRGKSQLTAPNRIIGSDWGTIPKDYTFYAVKYINTWDGNYLRRGKDVIVTNGNTETVSRRNKYVESDEIKKLNTIDLSNLELPLTFKNESGTNVPVSLKLQFDNTGKCTIVSNTAAVNSTGTGQFVKRGEKKSWGDQDRDALYLDYQVTVGARQYNTKDTLVMRDRGVAKEVFEVVPR
ncbi:DUF5627 domain-containing protein [Mucilaginibacter auburnensis]|nr:DUF5627 domain-containing protein [Mucilaginibacter auburnensis]